METLSYATTQPLILLPNSLVEFESSFETQKVGTFPHPVK